VGDLQRVPKRPESLVGGQTRETGPCPGEEGVLRPRLPGLAVVQGLVRVQDRMDNGPLLSGERRRLCSKQPLQGSQGVGSCVGWGLPWYGGARCGDLWRLFLSTHSGRVSRGRLSRNFSPGFHRRACGEPGLLLAVALRSAQDPTPGLPAAVSDHRVCALLEGGTPGAFVPIVNLAPKDLGTTSRLPIPMVDPSRADGEEVRLLPKVRPLRDPEAQEAGCSVTQPKSQQDQEPLDGRGIARSFWFAGSVPESEGVLLGGLGHTVRGVDHRAAEITVAR